MITSLTVLLVLLQIIYAPTSQAAEGRFVSGNITDQAGNPVAGATLTVSCLGNTKQAVTDVNGQYSVQFERLSHCLNGSTVSMTAQKNEATASTTQKMVNHAITINLVLDILPVTPVPEFGTYTALITGATAILYITNQRRRFAPYVKHH